MTSGISDKQEDHALFRGFLEDYFYGNFRFPESTHCVEIVFSPKCNLGCTYCYVKKNYGKAYPDHLYNAERSIANTEKVLAWMAANRFTCGINLFSGELFAQKAGYDLLDRMIAFYQALDPALRPRHITIPTNFTFLCSENYTLRVEGFYNALDKLGIPLQLSASFDGKYMEQNRPFVNDLDIPLNVIRDDAYYDRVFSFIREHRCGLHPMVYSRGIADWKRNFEWFQSMMHKHQISWDNLYLLQIRNPKWTKEQNDACYDLARYLLRYEFVRSGGTAETFLTHYFDTPNGGFNLCRNTILRPGRGLTCALQENLSIRASDLKLFPCHRLMYDHLEIGTFLPDEKEILRFETRNASLGLTAYGCDFHNFPVCIQCPMKSFCVGGCLGSQYETTGSLFVPIPTVCQNTYAINKAIIDELTALGLFDAFAARLDPGHRLEFITLRKVICDA